jgi:predicted amidohydrolase
MTRVAVLFSLTAAALLAADVKTNALHFQQSGFTEAADGWTVWSSRPDITPRTWVESTVSVGDPGSLAVSGNGNLGAFGGWQRTFTGIEPGAWYRLTASYRHSGITSPNWQIQPRLDWHRANGGRVGEVDYAYQGHPEGEWTGITLSTQAPANASNVTLQLFLAHAPQGTVWWDNIAFEQIPPPGPRNVTIASVNLRPRNSASPEQSVRQFVETIERAVPANADLILLPEGITVVGTNKKYADVAETIPGPTTATLGELARKRKAYIAAGIYEREGQVVYNTAVLLDRQGKLAGKYRKVYLPREEMEQLAPGNDYPVFHTDFGTVGIMICYDVFFSDPARGLATKGAEIVLLPIWGGDQTLAKARAIENQVFLVASGYDHPTYIMNPDGERIASAPEQGSVAVATIDLNKSLRQLNNNLGDMRNRRPRELRVDVDALSALR